MHVDVHEVLLVCIPPEVYRAFVSGIWAMSQNGAWVFVVYVAQVYVNDLGQTAHDRSSVLR